MYKLLILSPKYAILWVSNYFLFFQSGVMIHKAAIKGVKLLKILLAFDMKTF